MPDSVYWPDLLRAVITMPGKAPAAVAAIDVGGTLIKGGVFGADEAGITIRRTTPRLEGPDAVVSAILTTIDQLLKDAGRVSAIGLVVPGIVDNHRGVAVYAENIGWHDALLRDLVERRTGLPVSLGHDVRACGQAEIRLGAARGARDAVILPIGTGIAAAMLVQGRLLATANGVGEIGHMDVGHQEQCACGGHGCLEAVASAAAIARRYATRTGRDVTGAADVAKLVHGGDPDATKVWNEAIGSLATALAAYTTLMAPEVVAIGGGLSGAGDLLLRPLDDRLTARLTFQRRPRLVAAALGDEAGCVGAALEAWDLLSQVAAP
jgi:glucokinase